MFFIAYLFSGERGLRSIKALLLSQKPTEISFDEAEKIQQLFLLLKDFKQLSFLSCFTENFEVKCNCRF